MEKVNTRQCMLVWKILAAVGRFKKTANLQYCCCGGVKTWYSTVKACTMHNYQVEHICHQFTTFPHILTSSSYTNLPAATHITLAKHMISCLFLFPIMSLTVQDNGGPNTATVLPSCTTCTCLSLRKLYFYFSWCRITAATALPPKLPVPPPLQAHMHNLPLPPNPPLNVS